MLLDKKGPIAQAKVLRKLINDSGLTVKEAAERIHKSSAYVSNTLRLLSLPDALQDGLVSGLISAGHARALAAIKDNRTMVAAYKEILRSNASVRQAEFLARGIKGKEKSSEKMLKRISRALGGAKIRLFRSRVQSRMVITLRGGYEKTEPYLKKIYRCLIKPNLSGGQ